MTACTKIFNPLEKYQWVDDIPGGNNDIYYGQYIFRIDPQRNEN